MAVISKDYSFTLSQNYDYNDSEIEISSGNAQLLATSSVYPTTNPSITNEHSLIATSINSFTETSTTGTGDLIRYIIEVDDEYKYHDGTNWITSDGTYAQSNLASDIQINSSTIISGRSRIGFKAFLHSYDGSTTPQLNTINISYNFSAYCLPADVRSSLVGVDKGSLSDEEITTHIELADDTIDFYLGMQYTLPITNSSTLSLLRTWSIILSSYNIYVYMANKEGTNISNLATERYNKLIETLDAISNGDKTLTGLPNTDRFSCTTEDYNATFNLGNPFNWQVDGDLLDDIADGNFD